MSEKHSGGSRSDYSMRDFMSDFEDRYAARAKFSKRFAKHPDLLDELERSADWAWATCLETWLFEAEHYHSSPFATDNSENYKFKKRLTRITGKEAAVRAYVLNKAISRILQIIGAPEQMIKDLDTFLSDFSPTGSDAAEKVQRAVINNKIDTLNKSKEDEAKDLEMHRATIHELLSSNIIKTPES